MRYGKDANGRGQDKDGQIVLNFRKPTVAAPPPSTGENRQEPQQTIVALFLTPHDLWVLFQIPLSTRKVYRWQTAHNRPDTL